MSDGNALLTYIKQRQDEGIHLAGLHGPVHLRGHLVEHREIQAALVLALLDVGEKGISVAHSQTPLAGT